MELGLEEGGGSRDVTVITDERRDRQKGWESNRKEKKKESRA